MLRIYFRSESKYADMDPGQLLQEGVVDIGIEESIYVVPEALAEKLEDEIEDSEYVSAVDLVNNSDTAAEVYDNHSFTSFVKNQDLEAQNSFEEAYEIFKHEVKCFEEFYNDASESWTDIYVAENGTKYAVYGDGELTACDDFIVLKLK